jgi:hypothetical protein
VTVEKLADTKWGLAFAGSQAAQFLAGKMTRIAPGGGTWRSK